MPMQCGARGRVDWSLIAAESADLSDFLRRVAAELRVAFGAGIVAVHAAPWDSPEMLVADEWLASQLNRDAIKSTLASITTLATAADLATPVGLARSIGIELQPAPKRAAVLLVYPLSKKLAPAQQIQSLKQLHEIRTGVAAAMHRFDAPQVATKKTDAATIGAGDLSRLHLDLDLNATAYRIANESRRLLKPDRVTVLTTRRTNYRVTAVSGVAVIDRRSNTVRTSEELCKAASVLGRGIVLPGDEDLPPQIVQPLNEYLDESKVMCVVLLPLGFSRGDNQADTTARDVDLLDTLHRDFKQSGMMMLEYFSGDAPRTLSPSMELVRRDATLALSNSMEHGFIFGLPVWMAIGRIVDSKKRVLWLTLAAALVSAIVAGCVIPIDHVLIATGTLEPSVRRQVFANLDGTVKQLKVVDGDIVKAGDVLVVMENAELESQGESIAGEVQTKLQRLASTRSLRLSGSGDANRDSQLALEQRQLENELDSLRTQAKIVAEMQRELTIISPIGGRIVAWQLAQRLQNRPIGRGNLILSVIDDASPWRLNLEVADEDAGTVLASIQSTKTLPIRFAVATEPTRTYQAELVSVSTASRLSEAGKQVMDAIAEVDASENLVAESSGVEVGSGHVRVGSGVTAKIVCGQRSVLASWFSDVIDFAHRHVIFYFR